MKCRYASAVFVAAGVVGSLSWATSGCELLIHSVTLDVDGATSSTGCDQLLLDGAARPGPTMVRIDHANGSYCIDTTEVTNKQFNAFLVSSGEQIDTPDFCSAAPPFPMRVTNSDAGELPASGMSVCHAWSYCKWAGKRLCGLIGDGGFNSYNNPAYDEWINACSNGRNATAFPYGDDYDGSVCNTNNTGPVNVGSMTLCHGQSPPYARLFDMSGNVAEFTNDITSGATVPRGGQWNTKDQNRCATYGAANYILGGNDALGFRCCSDL